MPGRAPARAFLLPAVFSLAVFLSAALLFLVQPMVGRMVLPLFGGAAAVWNTCLVFYQAVLLLGYLYAHALSSRSMLAGQWLAHGALLIVVLALLPIGLSPEAAPGGDESPALALLWRLTTTVGLPFFALSGTGTVLQAWFSRSGHAVARDPYFLYAASNLGSMLALLAYPTLVEPRLGLADQSRLWGWSYLVLAVIVIACGRFVARAARPAPSIADPAGPAATGRQRLAWLGLAFVPSSLMMGTTFHLTTDIAPVPLLWVVPLGLYLLAFIVAFARLPVGVARAVGAAAGPVTIALLFFLLSEMRAPTWFALLHHLVALFLLSATYLGKLASTRPPPEHLTEFYLWVALGGVAGGAFNALLAPLVFETAAEYLLMLILAVALMPWVRLRASAPKPWPSGRAVLAELAAAAAVGGLCAWLVSSPAPLGRIDLTAVGNLVGFPRWRITTALTYAAPFALCLVYYLLDRTVAFALALAAVAGVCTLDNESGRRVVLRDRSFFSVLTVADDPEGDCRHLLSGVTPHGRQFIDPRSRSTPLAFYLREGPVGDVFRALDRAGKGDVAVVGLGTGAIAAYGETGQRMTFYEIDPAVARIARDSRLFSYLADSKAAVEVVLGDARLRLREARPAAYRLLIVDAFSSDAIPTHLLTREAVALYLDKVAPGGLVAIHISNRYVDLAGLAGRLAADAGLAIRLRQWGGGDGCARFATRWVVLARDERDLGSLATAWDPVAVPAGTPLWTDDYCDLAALLDLG
jgi:hypothetical protein